MDYGIEERTEGSKRLMAQGPPDLVAGIWCLDRGHVTSTRCLLPWTWHRQIGTRNYVLGTNYTPGGTKCLMQAAKYLVASKSPVLVTN